MGKDNAKDIASSVMIDGRGQRADDGERRTDGGILNFRKVSDKAVC